MRDAAPWTTGAIDPADLNGTLLDGRRLATSVLLVWDVVPRYLTGGVMVTFGMERIVEELESIEQFARANEVPAAVTGSTAALYREALEHFGPIAGELLGMKYTGGER
ncbi:hypothetical protein GCM10009745_58430 [Kribbella yunnanensis]|uniref:Uncharacterized protein n=1 Tax=Kribbella yunnanensis TaxID=190194 RepID=A0ABN2IE31_9ACTN